MLTKVKTLEGYTLHATDGALGTVKEFYFDDQSWAVRYLVAATGGWLTGRQVLISPHAFGAVSAQDKAIAINLTKKQIEDGPGLNNDEPVSRQFEETYYNYYQFPAHWGSQWVEGGYPYPLEDFGDWTEESKPEKSWDPHLRSTNAVRGQHVESTDGEIGHVEDFVLDEDTWRMRYLIVDTRDLWPGKRVLISPTWFDRISLNNQKLYLNLTRKAIKDSPEYSDEVLTRSDYETALHTHYGLEGYGGDEPRSKVDLL